MLLNLYLASATLFLLQGAAIPVLIVASGWLWLKHGRLIDELRKEAGPAVRGGMPVEALLAAMPKYTPLQCAACGAGLLLRPAQTICSSCHTPGELPADYAMTAALKPRIDAALESAVGHWRAANVLTHPAVRWVLTAMIFFQPVLLFAVVIGGSTYSDTTIDRALKAMGGPAAFALMAASLLGFVLWMITFIMMRNASKALRSQLPAVPKFGSAVGEGETASCQSCGGAIEYAAGAGASVCGFCTVVNLRVQLVRRQRMQAEKQYTQSRSVLFGAMEIIEDYIGTFFITMSLLTAAAMLLVVFYAIRG